VADGGWRMADGGWGMAGNGWRVERNMWRVTVCFSLIQELCFLSNHSILKP